MKALGILLLKILLGVVVLLLIYIVVSFVFSRIPVNTKQPDCDKNKFIFLNTNGVHLDIAIPKEELVDEFVQGIKIKPSDKYVSIGWGDRGFYVNTPTWADLTVKVAVRAMFLKSKTLMHVTKYEEVEVHWVKIPVCQEQLNDLKAYITASFKATNQQVIELEGHSYGDNDEFYEAKGSYSLFKTCNTWANKAMKKAGLKTAFWTPMDDGVLRYYKK